MPVWRKYGSKSRLEQVWDLRLVEVAEALRGNNFKVDVFGSLQEAVIFFKNEIFPLLAPERVGAGSETVTHSGVYQFLNEASGIEFLNPYQQGLSQEERAKV